MTIELALTPDTPAGRPGRRGHRGRQRRWVRRPGPGGAGRRRQLRGAAGRGRAAMPWAAGPSRDRRRGGHAAPCPPTRRPYGRGRTDAMGAVTM